MSDLIRATLDSFKSLGSVAKRMVSYQLASSDGIQLQFADVVIHPIVDGIGLITTKPRDAQQAMRAGEQAARNILPLIEAKLQAAQRAIAGSSGAFR